MGTAKKRLTKKQKTIKEANELNEQGAGIEFKETETEKAIREKIDNYKSSLESEDNEVSVKSIDENEGSEESIDELLEDEDIDPRIKTALKAQNEYNPEAIGGVRKNKYKGGKMVNTEEAEEDSDIDDAAMHLLNALRNDPPGNRQQLNTLIIKNVPKPLLFDIKKVDKAGMNSLVRVVITDETTGKSVEVPKEPEHPVKIFW